MASEQDPVEESIFYQVVAGLQLPKVAAANQSIYMCDFIYRSTAH